MRYTALKKAAKANRGVGAAIKLEESGAVDQLQTRLSNEISRREDLENREAQLVRDREEAFNEIDDLKRTSEQLEHAIAQKDLRISEYESQCRCAPMSSLSRPPNNSSL